MVSAVGATLTSDGRRDLAEYELRIKIDAVFPQERDEFVVERHFLVVGFLRLNVAPDRWQDRTAHAECSIAFLPGESAALFARPSGGIRLDGKDRLRQRHGRRNLEQEMDVVSRPADGVNQDAEVLADSAGICPELRPEVGGDCVAAVLRAENNVNRVLRVYV
jgi:hypothetical protein